MENTVLHKGNTHLLFAHVEQGHGLVAILVFHGSHVSIQHSKNIDIQRSQFDSPAVEELSPGIKQGTFGSHHVHFEFIVLAG